MTRWPWINTMKWLCLETWKYFYSDGRHRRQRTWNIIADVTRTLGRLLSLEWMLTSGWRGWHLSRSITAFMPTFRKWSWDQSPWQRRERTDVGQRKTLLWLLHNFKWILNPLLQRFLKMMWTNRLDTNKLSLPHAGQNKFESLRWNKHCQTVDNYLCSGLGDFGRKKN